MEGWAGLALAEARSDTCWVVSCALGATKAMQLPAERANAVADATRPAMVVHLDRQRTELMQELELALAKTACGIKVRNLKVL